MVPYTTLLKYIIYRPSKWPAASQLLFALSTRRKRTTIFSDGIFLQCGIGGGKGVWCALTGLDYEKELIDFINLLKPSDIVFDIGANIGTYAIRSAKKLEPFGQVFAFEPLDENHEMLLHSCTLNSVNNITVVKKAVGDKVGTVIFSHSGRNSSAKILAEPNKDSRSVEIITLDDFVEQNRVEQIDWIKMDIEGAEPLVLEGMKKTLKFFQPSFLFENHEGGKKTCDILLANGYKIGSFNKGHFEETVKSENLFAIHNNRLAAFSFNPV
jgi:FkbM family methyltransferase